MRRLLLLLIASCCIMSGIPINAHAANTDQKRIVLTFDDGPHPKQTRQILDVLDKYGIKATFFVIGLHAKTYPGIIAEVLERGHEIGNHTTTHSHAKNMNIPDLIHEITTCENEIFNQTGIQSTLFRPPEGATTAESRQVVKKLGYTSVFWTLDTRDWAHTPPDKISEYIIQNAKNGDIILMHDYIGANSPTVKALEIFVPVLIEQGFTFVTAGELLESQK